MVEIIALVLAIVAVTTSLSALFIASRKAGQDSPLEYDEEAKAFHLNGSLYADGFICARGDEPGSVNS